MAKAISKRKSRPPACQHEKHPEYSDLSPRLKRVEGQVAGIQRMVSEGRYCVDILIQFQAIASALKAIEGVVLERHLKSCVQEALQSKNKNQIQEKTKELMNLFFKRMI